MKFEVQDFIGCLDDQQKTERFQDLCDEMVRTRVYQGGPFGIVKGCVNECYIRPLKKYPGTGVIVRKVDGNLLFYLYNWWIKAKIGFYRWYKIAPFTWDLDEIDS